ncbi:unnamed protein product [Penicillium salamii]|nr:unnamed protein product [Penicillium salamii]
MRHKTEKANRTQWLEKSVHSWKCQSHSAFWLSGGQEEKKESSKERVKGAETTQLLLFAYIYNSTKKVHNHCFC